MSLSMPHTTRCIQTCGKTLRLVTGIDPKHMLFRKQAPFVVKMLRERNTTSKEIRTTVIISLIVIIRVLVCFSPHLYRSVHGNQLAVELVLDLIFKGIENIPIYEAASLRSVGVEVKVHCQFSCHNKNDNL